MNKLFSLNERNCILQSLRYDRISMNCLVIDKYWENTTSLYYKLVGSWGIQSNISVTKFATIGHIGESNNPRPFYWNHSQNCEPLFHFVSCLLFIFLDQCKQFPERYISQWKQFVHCQLPPYKIHNTIFDHTVNSAEYSSVHHFIWIQ